MNDLRPGDAGGNLTEFGQWFMLLMRLLDTNPTQIGKRAQVGRATIADLVHPKADGRTVRPDPETLSKLWQAIQQLALERSGHTLSLSYQEGFWYAASRGDPQTAEQARMRLQELTLFVALEEQKNHLIADLRREIHVLSKSKRKRRRE